MELLKNRTKEENQRERSAVKSRSLKRLEHDHKVQCGKITRLETKLRNITKKMEARLEKEGVKAYVLRDRCSAKTNGF